MLLILAAAVLTILMVSHEFITRPLEQKRRLLRLVPEFSCPDMWVETHSGRMANTHRLVRGVLQMPGHCRRALGRLVASSANFREDRCNQVERCWTHEDGGERFTLTFYPTYAAFRHTERP